MSGIKVVTDWTASAVATSDQKSFMRVDFSDDDSLIAELIKASQNVIQTYLNRAITTQTLELYLDRLPFYNDLKISPGHKYDEFIEKLYKVGVHDLKIIDNSQEEINPSGDIEVEGTLSFLEKYVEEIDYEDKDTLKSIIGSIYSESMQIE